MRSLTISQGSWSRPRPPAERFLNPRLRRSLALSPPPPGFSSRWTLHRAELLTDVVIGASPRKGAKDGNSGAGHLREELDCFVLLYLVPVPGPARIQPLPVPMSFTVNMTDSPPAVTEPAASVTQPSTNSSQVSLTSTIHAAIGLPNTHNPASLAPSYTRPGTLASIALSAPSHQIPSTTTPNGSPRVSFSSTPEHDLPRQSSPSASTNNNRPAVPNPLPDREEGSATPVAEVAETPWVAEGNRSSKWLDMFFGDLTGFQDTY